MSFNPLSLILGVAASTNPLLGFGLSMAQMALEKAMVPKPQQVPILQEVKQAHASSIVTATTDHPVINDVTVAGVKSSWLSKINWVQFAAPTASAFAAFGLNLSADQIVAVVMSIQAFQSVATWVLRTWFTKTVTTASMKQ